MTLPLSYAGSRFERKSIATVVLSGFLTTAATLIALHFAQPNFDWEIPSVTVDWFPVGAVGVGLIAGAGYSIAAGLLHVRMQTWMILLIVLLQIVSYFVGCYVESRANGPMYFAGTNQPVSFVEYYRLQTTTMRWESSGPSYNQSPRLPELPQGPGTMNPAPPPPPA